MSVNKAPRKSVVDFLGSRFIRPIGDPAEQLCALINNGDIYFYHVCDGICDICFAHLR